MAHFQKQKPNKAVMSKLSTPPLIATTQQEALTMAVIANTTRTTNKIDIPVRTRHLGRRVLRGLARGTAVTLALIVGLAAVGASYEAIAAGGDAKAYPAPGRLVDVGGYRLHILCVGTGSPTVVLDAGLGGTSLDWNLVQAEIGNMAQVCSYDRAGMGWSDGGPQPRTPGQIARELHTLLTNAGITGPYVLVGHSVGGKYVRMFALQYPDQVAGMVLVDARSEYADEPALTSQTGAADTQSTQQVSGSEWSLYGVARRLGLIRLVGPGPWGPPAMSDETRMEIALLSTGQRGLDATAAEALSMTADNAQLQAAPSLGDKPLIVLAAGQSMGTIPRWTEAQHQQAAMSTNGRLIVVEGSGHYIQLEHPAVVVDAVRQVHPERNR
jgi:pimeloyl-ACP methyl ester carboxylesterase